MSLTLESFEAELDTATGSGADHAQSFDDGYAAGVAAVEASNKALSDTLVQAISDMDFTYAEARAHLLQRLTPLFTAIAEQVLPHCVASGFTGQLAAELFGAAEADADVPIALHIHPDQQAAVTKALGYLAERVNLATDPDITLNSAWISRGADETLLDMDTVLAQITDFMGAINNQENRTTAHG